MSVDINPGIEVEERESIDRVLAIYDHIVPRVGGEKAVAAALTQTVVFDLHYSAVDEEEDG